MASGTDIITLDNFQARMPKWEPQLASHLYALVDMGSNGIRFSVSDLSPPHARLLKCLYRERAAISLFDALNSSSSSSSGGALLFPAETISQVSNTLARFKSIALGYGVPPENISIFATEAMRKAENAGTMLDAIFKASGLGVQILAPEVETLFGAMGARSSFSEVNGLFLDLGGGSVQMSYMNSAMEGYETLASQTGKSLPFGAARLIKILGGDANVQATAKNELESGLEVAFSKLKQQFAELRTLCESPNLGGIDVYLCGGGFRGYGSMLMHNDPIQPYPIPAIGSYTVSGQFFKETTAMRLVNEEYEGKIYGMSTRRRQQFPAITTVVDALITAVPNIRTVTFCAGGNREGALLMKLPRNIRETKPLTLLHQPDDETKDDVMSSVITTILSAAPTGFDFSKITTVFTLGLGRLFVGKIWSHLGEPSEANAAYELHRTVTRDPSTPGLTHLARAVLGLTTCARWGSTLGPIDQQLHIGLRKLAAHDSPEANFWADYFGVVASVLTTVCPAEPKAIDELDKLIRFSAKIVDGKKKPQIELTIFVADQIADLLERNEIGEAFKSVAKHKKEPWTVGRKVKATVVRMS
ncbi:hypothetical protein PFICI_01511 [Pestalotiopsis fici W106-1]|uniref:Uncharacterized protein n=1 Tax=Pestalotiopsis fici (strain W106-1 / CGMCC3.15140) TaxID=1229662 RepID=W3XNQ0_PESFW|nr:uncharacterized protein PFICI_01511 [Pestalotiopsis fici W106-1]ETS87683.1 hypothetical protein PFICI_01511 [Pestalotiopsis fici W106-1]